jgi:hypothetical protein
MLRDIGAGWGLWWHQLLCLCDLGFGHPYKQTTSFSSIQLTVKTKTGFY